MNLHEIEETLELLRTRHNGLNEAMLVTLLRSGGWEEKNIQEALLLFRSPGTGRNEETHTKAVGSLPPLHDMPDLPTPADEHHLLLDHNKSDLVPGNQEERVFTETRSEPEPLAVPSNPARAQKDEFPHNLPLRPFETSDHVWPFSRYRDVFYGDAQTGTVSEIKEEKKDQAASAIIKEEVGKVAVNEPRIPATEVKVEEKVAVATVVPPTPSPLEKEIMPVPLTKSDEKLVILACFMLVAILILLGYMYSNGRL